MNSDQSHIDAISVKQYANAASLRRIICACLLIAGIVPLSLLAGAQSSLSSGITNIAAGNLHSCALTTAGGVKCWGNNANGQLGDNTDVDHALPVNVPGLTSGVAAIAAGAFHNCVLGTGGGVKCWGSNEGGQLGDNSATQRNAPVNVSALSSGVSAIAAGVFSSCALTNAGGVKCWGDNGYGQLGDGSMQYHFSPADVSGLTTGVKAIASGNYHNCALTNSGGVKCWGYNGYGQSGNGTLSNNLTPVDVAGLASGVQAITAGANHTCALVTGGRVTCWGLNERGQLGDNSTINRLTPVDVLSGANMIVAGDSHTCALTTGGAVRCWGSNQDGGLGDNTTIPRLMPVSVTQAGAAAGMTALAAGGGHSCALSMSGKVRCWGANAFGQTGDDYSDLWWSGTAEDGWGMTISQHGGTQVNILYIYDNAGKPQWAIMPGGNWSADFTTYSGDLYMPSGPPFNNYNTALYSSGPKVGTLSITYTGRNNGVMRYSINGVTGQKNIERLGFSPDNNAPGLLVGDLWWGGIAENGWGINITQHGHTLFAVWYTYDESGREAWYTMLCSAWQGNACEGDLFYTTSSPWIGTLYSPSLLSRTKVGSMRFDFNDPDHAVMSYIVNGITQSKPIVRLPY